jgi:hypothetical protein
MMKLVRFNGGKTGLVVELPSGPHVIDVVGSLGVLVPDDPISQGVLNGILKDRGSWAPLIQHWRYARSGLRWLARLALANPEAPRLVIYPIGDVRLALPSAELDSIATLDIAELGELVRDPTGREVMARRFSSEPPVSDREDHREDQRVVVLDAHRTRR